MKVIIFILILNHTCSKLKLVRGIIYSCLWTQPNNKEQKIFPGRTFESLTDWCETCIQENYKNTILDIRHGEESDIKKLNFPWKPYTKNSQKTN